MRLLFVLLWKDLAKFPTGDETEVGERGLTLSGGQKARVALARVAYASASAASLVILDDPLAAVDPGVAAQIFRDCLREHLRDRLCLFVTNQHYLLSQCDLILVLNHGRLAASGTYDELVSKGFDFTSMLTKENDKSKETVEVLANAVANEDSASLSDEAENEFFSVDTNLGIVTEEGPEAEKVALWPDTKTPQRRLSRLQRSRTSSSRQSIVAQSRSSSLFVSLFKLCSSCLFLTSLISCSLYFSALVLHPCNRRKALSSQH